MTGAREWIPPSLAPQFAQRLRDRRKASGMTQPELARKAGVAKSTYLHWERGLVPDSIAAATVNALEAALQVPKGWLLSHETEPLPGIVFHAANTAARGGAEDREARVPPSRCRDIGLHARRLRVELGLSVAEVARASHVSRPTLVQWERGVFPKALTAWRLRAWEQALLLAPGQLLAPPVSHPRVRDGRWRVVIEADMLEAAIRSVAACLATRGRSLLRPDQTLDARARRDADLLAHRYGIGAHRWPLVDVAISYGMDPSHARHTVTRMIERATGFEFAIPVLDSIVNAGAAASLSSTAAAGDRMRDLLGPSLSLERAEAFAAEILSRRINDADVPVAVADQRAGIWQEESAKAVQDDNTDVEQHALNENLDERTADEQAAQRRRQGCWQ
ncbi:helix-turn-helix domain-containing protein [Paraburkholderia sp. BR10937]|uniref:helix-turn-helix domain-containing protein n=1 Tax=Paraburkholderia sp. BR10937 TaxID=3236994 RepID=UPI0034D16092